MACHVTTGLLLLIEYLGLNADLLWSVCDGHICAYTLPVDDFATLRFDDHVITLRPHPLAVSLMYDHIIFHVIAFQIEFD